MSESIINDSKMVEEIINDVMDNYGLSKKKAKEFAEENGEYIVSAMWNEYGSAIDHCMAKEK